MEQNALNLNRWKSNKYWRMVAETKVKKRKDDDDEEREREKKHHLRQITIIYTKCNTVNNATRANQWIRYKWWWCQIMVIYTATPTICSYNHSVKLLVKFM